MLNTPRQGVDRYYQALITLILLAPSLAVCEAVPFDTAEPINATGWDSRSVAQVQAADMNQDGNMDLVFIEPAESNAATSTPGRIHWLLSDGGTPPSYTFFDPVISGTTVAAGDLDSDDDLDLVVYRYSRGQLGFPPVSVTFRKLLWIDNRQSSSGDTVTHEIDGTSSMSGQPVLADFDLDGDLDVLITSFDSMEGTYLWYENNLNVNGTFPPRAFASAPSAGTFSQTFAIDANNDGWMDIITTSTDLSSNVRIHVYTNDGTPTVGTWSLTDLGQSPDDSVDLEVGDFNADGFDDIVIGQSNGIPVLRINNGTSEVSFTSINIDTSHAEDFPLRGTADLDRDGDIDLYSIDGWLENRFGGTWEYHEFDESVDGTRHFADLDSDSDVDMIYPEGANSIQSSANRLIHRAPDFAVPSALNSNAGEPKELVIADINQDGIKDIAYSVEGTGDIGWLEQGPDSRATFTPRPVAALGGAYEVDVADINHDGFLDFIAADANANSVKWFAHDGTAAPSFWEVRTIVSNVEAETLATGDIRNDGDIDVMIGNTNNHAILWYENDGTPESVSGTDWLVRVALSGPLGIEMVRLHDINSDGDVDYVAAFSGSGQVWYGEQSNNAGTINFAGTSIATLAGAHTVFPTDIDGDGGVDILAGGSVCTGSIGNEVCTSELILLRNNGSASFTRVSIDSTLRFMGDIHVDDIDNDGDLDIVTSQVRNVSLFDYSDVLIFINDGGSTPQFTRETVHSTFPGGAMYNDFETLDLNNDGYRELISAGRADEHIDSFENISGQVTVQPFDVAPATVAEGARTAVLRFNVAHRGIEGDEDFTVTLLRTQFRDAGSQLLSSLELHKIADAIKVFRDNGDSVFNDVSDQEVPYLSVQADGAITMAFFPIPQSMIGAGESQDFFLVVDLNAFAADLPPTEFRAFLDGALMELEGDILDSEAIHVDSRSASSKIISVLPTINDLPSRGTLIDTDLDGFADYLEVYLGSVETDSNSVPLFGDFNLDGTTNILDAIMYARYLEENSLQGLLMDIDLDGDNDLSDAQALFEWSIGDTRPTIIPVE